MKKIIKASLISSLLLTSAFSITNPNFAKAETNNNISVRSISAPPVGGSPVKKKKTPWYKNTNKHNCVQLGGKNQVCLTP